MTNKAKKKRQREAIFTEELTVLISPEDMEIIEAIAKEEDRSKAYIVRKVLHEKITLNEYKEKLEKINVMFTVGD